MKFICLLTLLLVGCKTDQSIRFEIKHNPIEELGGCSFDYPLLITINNDTDKTVKSVNFHIAMRLPKYSSDIAFQEISLSDKIIKPHSSTKSCWRVPYKTVVVLQTKECHTEYTFNSKECRAKCSDIFNFQICSLTEKLCQGSKEICNQLPFDEWKHTNLKPEFYKDHIGNNWIGSSPIIFTKNGEDWYEVTADNLPLLKQNNYFIGSANLHFDIENPIVTFE